MMKLLELLSDSTLTPVMGAHDALTARVCVEAGFPAVWASGLEISTAHGVPDANILSMDESRRAAVQIARSVSVPTLADCDSGFGDAVNVAHMVQAYEADGVAGVCIEDKPFPKTNSFIPDGQELSSIEEFTAKIIAAADARLDSDFVIVARTEALVVGRSMDEALARAMAYEEAGADALLVHSKQTTPDEVFAFMRAYTGSLPIVVVPTTYHQVTRSALEAARVSAVIFANQGLRSAIAALKSTAAALYRDCSSAALEPQLASLDEVFALSGVPEMLRKRRQYERMSREVADSVQPNFET